MKAARREFAAPALAGRIGIGRTFLVCAERSTLAGGAQPAFVQDGKAGFVVTHIEYALVAGRKGHGRVSRRNDEGHERCRVWWRCIWSRGRLPVGSACGALGCAPRGRAVGRATHRRRATSGSASRRCVGRRSGETVHGKHDGSQWPEPVLEAGKVRTRSELPHGEGSGRESLRHRHGRTGFARQGQSLRPARARTTIWSE